MPRPELQVMPRNVEEELIGKVRAYWSMKEIARWMTETHRQDVELTQVVQLIRERCSEGDALRFLARYCQDTLLLDICELEEVRRQLKELSNNQSGADTVKRPSTAASLLLARERLLCAKLQVGEKIGSLAKPPFFCASHAPTPPDSDDTTE